jgi:pSer/pThr/pTyr-binding forkhead associated (FHA) protein
MAILCVLDDAGIIRKQWEIGEEPVVVGRGTSVQVKIDDAALSRRHFLIQRDGEHYVLQDLSSRNGTWLEGQRALLIKLQDNDRIMAGHTEFRFSAQPSASEQAPANGLEARRASGPHGTVVLSARA